MPRSLSAPRLALAVISGALLGAGSEALVLHVSFSLLPLSNSAGPWILLAFLVALTARGAKEALLLAFITLIALILGFYVAESIRGFGVSHHQVALWFLVSFVAGPLIGLAADRLRRGAPIEAAAGAGLVGGILVGEAVHGLREYDFLTPHTYWRVQIVVGLAIAIGPVLWRRRGAPTAILPTLIVALASCAASGVATLIVYELT